MDDRFAPGAVDLERELAELSRLVVVPPAPTIAMSVAARLRHRPVGRPRPWPRLGLAVSLAVVALLLVVVAAAAAAWFLGGVRLVFTDAGVSPTASSVVPSHPLGSPSSLDEAARKISFRILLPAGDELGPPDDLFVDPRHPSGGSIALVYGARPGYPSGENGVAVTITEFRADITPEVFEKLIHSGVHVEPATVNGARAYWVSGGTHFFFYRDADGRFVEETLRLVGETLIWESSGITIRIEGAPSLAAARRVAASLR